MVAATKDWCHLIVSRKEGERLVVDGPAVIELVQNRGGRSTWSIRAPKTTRILREELTKPQTETK